MCNNLKKGGRRRKNKADREGNKKQQVRVEGQDSDFIDEFDIDGVVLQKSDHLMTEQEFNAAFRHPPKAKADDNAVLVIRPEKEADHKYEVFRQPEIIRQLQENRIQILDTLRFKKFVNTYRAQYDDGLVVLKMIDMLNMEPEERQLYANDIEFRKQLQHNRIIKTHLFMLNLTGRKNFLVMEFAERGALCDIMEENGPITEDVAAKMFCELQEGLRFLLNRLTVHRNITLETILVTQRGMPKLTDFKFAIQCASQNQELNTAVGKAEFLAPEVLRVTEKPYNGFVADVWSLSVCFFMMLNGGRPFRGGTLEALYAEQQKHQLRWRELVKDDISEEVKLLLERTLEPNIAARHTLQSLQADPYMKAVRRAIRQQKTTLKLAALEQLETTTTGAE